MCLSAHSTRLDNGHDSLQEGITVQQALRLLYPHVARGTAPGNIPLQTIRACCESFTARLPLPRKPICLECSGKAFITLVMDGNLLTAGA